LAVDSRTLAVLDGVHRLNALRRLQCRRVSVCPVDYPSEEILVYSTDRSSIIRKDVVNNAALSGKKFRPRSTWHLVRMPDGSLEHISPMEEEVHLPLTTLTIGAVRKDL